MGNLAIHAKRELELAGLFDKDSDYGGMIAENVMGLIEVFAKQGNSGFSAMQTLQVFDRVAHFKPLTGINDNTDDWSDVSEASGRPMWQSRRCPSVFSEDGGKTWYDLDAPKQQ